MSNTTTREVVLDALTKFPKAGSKTVADYLFKQHPAIFSSVESARSSVRYYRGNKGKLNRSRLTVRDHVRSSGKAGVSFPALPPARKSFDSWGAVEIEGPSKILVLSDIHVPYYDQQALEAAVERGAGSDVVLLNGDTMDCYEVSNFQPDPRKCDFPAAMQAGRELFAWLRAKFPNARIIFKEGNHEERLERYLTTRAPAVLGCEEFRLENLLKAEAWDIEWVKDKRPVRLGKLNVLHGHEYRFPISNPVNPARGLFMRAKVHALCGHFHQSAQHSERNLEHKVVSTWSTGCLCDLYPEYLPLNNWSHGAATVEVDDSGAFHVDNFRIIDGKTY